MWGRPGQCDWTEVKGPQPVCLLRKDRTPLNDNLLWNLCGSSVHVSISLERYETHEEPRKFDQGWREKKKTEVDTFHNMRFILLISLYLCSFPLFIFQPLDISCMNVAHKNYNPIYRTFAVNLLPNFWIASYLLI